jgi:serine/threonine-protein kinase RsbW
MEKSIIISSKIENLRLVESFLEEICTECKVDQEKYGNILISSLEAANNAIVHGNKLNDKANVTIKVFTTKKNINIEVQDSGKGFDYDIIPDPTSPENVEKLNGRGIFIMKKLSDKINFKNNGTIVELIFDL